MLTELWQNLNTQAGTLMEFYTHTSGFTFDEFIRSKLQCCYFRSQTHNLSHKFLRIRGIVHNFRLPFRQLDTKFDEQNAVRVIEAQAPEPLLSCSVHIFIIGKRPFRHL
jgi:hypothetical protein